MSRVLAIGDVHLKPQMFDIAHRILVSRRADMAVQMGDIVDDWGLQFAVAYYQETVNAAIKFQRQHPNTKWCMGNHDFGYYHPIPYGRNESGHSIPLEPIVESLFKRLEKAGAHPKIAHLIDNTIFTHAGLTAEWVEKLLEGKDSALEPEEVIDTINNADLEILWKERGPLWTRPQWGDVKLWGDKLQVVGHTPVRSATKIGNLLSTDTFSTYQSGAPYGDEKMVIVDTITGEWERV